MDTPLSMKFSYDLNCFKMFREVRFKLWPLTIQRIQLGQSQRANQAFFLVFADLYINFTKSLDNQIKSNTIHYKNTHTYSISRCTYVNRWSVYLSIDWSIYLSTNLSVYLSIYLIDLIYLISLMYLICLICLINLSNLSNHSNQANLLNLSDLSKVYLIYLVYQSIDRSVCLSVRPSTCLSMYVQIYMFLYV
jgi:hypothetical protein